MILENLLRDLMFDVPSDESIAEIHVEKETITEGKMPLVVRNHDKKIA